MVEQKEKPQEFKSDAVTFTIERKPECMVEYKVKTSAEVVKKARREAIKSVSKEVSLPGFRKGRAPDHLIAKKFAEPVNERWQKAIADEAFRECQKLAHTPLLSNDAKISFNIDKHSIEEGAEMTYTFETEPVVPDINLANVEVEEVKRETIDEKRIEKTLSDIQSYFVEWEKISDRTAKEGDYALIDADIIDQDPPENVLSSARFEIQKGKMANWMHELIVGMKIGESKEGLSKPDEDASKDEKESMPPKKVRLTLRGIEIPHYPAIDDSLAQKMGTKDAKELRIRLEKLLNKQADEHVQKEYREQMSAFLLDHYQFELPKTLLQKETQFRIKQLVQDPSFQQKLMKMGEEERKAAIKDIETQGEKAVRLFYISRKIIQDNKISITPSEVHQGVSTPLEAMFSDQSDLYTAQEQSQEQKAIATSRLILSKAEDFLISKAKVVPPKPKKKAAAPKKPEAKKEEEPEKKKAAPKKTAAKKTAPKKTSSEKKAAPKKKSTKST
ncbi:MAG: trigger factor [Simkaniaceae bacterium]|nr:MAG: trigger factor [Simkaniaceae bacterium]